MFKTQPIKRNKNLVRFSQEHHFGLQLCQKIREGIRNNIEPKRISAYTLFFFEQDLKRHFEQEENHLFPKLEKESSLLKRALREHREIYHMIDKICSDIQNAELLDKLANTIEKHIRFEERTLFDFLQNNFTEELIAIGENNIGKAIDVSDDWNDKFWNYKNNSNEK